MQEEQFQASKYSPEMIDKLGNTLSWVDIEIYKLAGLALSCIERKGVPQHYVADAELRTTEVAVFFGMESAAGSISNKLKEWRDWELPELMHATNPREDRPTWGVQVRMLPSFVSLGACKCAATRDCRCACTGT